MTDPPQAQVKLLAPFALSSFPNPEAKMALAALGPGFEGEPYCGRSGSVPASGVVLQPEQTALLVCSSPGADSSRQQLEAEESLAGRNVVWKGPPGSPGLWEEVQGFCVTVESPSE